MENRAQDSELAEEGQCEVPPGKIFVELGLADRVICNFAVFFFNFAKTRFCGQYIFGNRLFSVQSIITSIKYSLTYYLF